MRAFYLATLSYFVGSFIWFSVAPLQTAIQTDLGLSDQDLFTASIASIAGCLMMRVAVGPMCDLWGAKRLEVILLVCGSIACGLTAALVQTSQGLIVGRFFTGMAGGMLPVSQFWTSCMFTKDIIGLATGLVVGVGISGGGFSLLILGSLVLPQLERVSPTTSLAWRLTLVVPTVLGLLTAAVVGCFGDDTPRGRYRDRTPKPISAATATLPTSSDSLNNKPDDEKFRRFLSVVRNRNTWILFLQMGVTSGGNVAMENAAPLYFYHVIGLSKASSSAVSAAAGWLYLIMFVGGLLSDKLMATRFRIAGRKGSHFALLSLGGLLVLAIHVDETGPSIAAFTLFALFLTLATGTTVAMVPYVDPASTGTVAGIAASGGSVGAIAFLLLLRQMSYYESFVAIGSIVVVSAFLSLLLRFPGQRRKSETTGRSSSMILESAA